jgi:hypothetical protein
MSLGASDARDPAMEIVNSGNRQTVLQLGPIQPRIEFPARFFGERLLRFQPNWYAKYEWLEYSMSGDSAGCFFCRCYGSLGESYFKIQKT